jgi:hypothetical protein
VPSGSGTPDILVTVGGLTGATPNILTYDPAPTISSVVYDSEVALPSGGTPLTITGTNFGPNKPKSDTVFHGIMIGGKKSDTCTSWTSTVIVCLSPTGVGNNLPIKLVLGENVATAEEQFAYKAPLVTMVVPANAPTYGTMDASVTIVGQNFGTECATSSGADPAGTCNFTVFIGTRPCTQVLWWSDTSMACAVPPGVGASLKVVVNAGGQMSAGGDSLFTYNPPTVMSLTPYSAPSQDPGLPITVSGMNFGTLPGERVEVLIGPSSCQNILWQSDTSVSCRLPVGSGTRLVTVNATGNPSASTPQAFFTYEGAPVISRLSPPSLATSGGITLTIFGSNFKEIGSEQVTVRVHTLNCSMLPSPREPGRVACVPPTLSGGPFDVTLRVGNRETVAKEFLYVDAPIITSVHADEGALATGAPITIIGRNFGTVPQLPPPHGLELLIGTQQCPTAFWDSDTVIRCFVGIGGIEIGASTVKLRSMGRTWSTQTFVVNQISAKPTGLEIVVGVRSLGSSVELIRVNTSSSVVVPEVLGAFLVGSIDYGLSAVDPVVGHMYVLSYATDGSATLTTLDIVKATLVSRVPINVAEAMNKTSPRRSILSHTPTSTGVIANLEFVPDQRSLVGVLAGAGGTCLRTQVIFLFALDACA